MRRNVGQCPPFFGGEEPVRHRGCADIALEFIGPDDFLVLEKNTGRVQRIVNGALQGTVLDLAVNAASERGLLGIALHPQFPDNPGVYLSFLGARFVE